MPSYGGAHGPDGSKKSGDQGQGSRDRKSGGTTDRGGGGLSDKDIRDLMTGKDWPSSAPGGAGIKRTGTYSDRTRGVDDLTALDAAANKYQTRNKAWDVLDFFSGPFIDANAPDFTKPGSFRYGDWHTSTNPVGVLGSILGGAAGVPVVGGLLGSWAGNQLGVPDIYHGGFGTGGGGSAPGPLGGGTGNGRLGQPGPLAPKPGQLTPATPLGPTAPQAAAVPGYQPPSWLNVPGPSPYSAQKPGYNFWRGM